MKKDFDYIIVGGGTAGSVLAARLTEKKAGSVCLIEAGPSDENEKEILELLNWPNLLETKWDYDYTIEKQVRGNSSIRHSRAKVLGGCSSHNSCIAFKAPQSDFDEWMALGAKSFTKEKVDSYYKKVWESVHTEYADSSNACSLAFVEAAQELNFPLKKFNQEEHGRGVGLFELNKKGNLRQSSSVSYLHPLSRWIGTDLTILFSTKATKVLFEKKVAVGVSVIMENGAGEKREDILRAHKEVIVCAGAFDTPKLLLLSGVGSREELMKFDIPLVSHLPGVGENLLDHPEGVIQWEASRQVPEESTQFWEAGLFEHVLDTHSPDLMFHFGTVPFDSHTKALGYPSAENVFCLTPNVARAKSQGKVTLKGAHHEVPPSIDFRYFTDEESYDERVMTKGIELARMIVMETSLRNWVKRELTPGSGVTSFKDLSHYVRRTANTVYHPAGTCKMGSEKDEMSVVDGDFKVLGGIEKLRVVDASVFPSMVSVNPNMTCMMLGEKCADLLT